MSCGAAPPLNVANSRRLVDPVHARLEVVPETSHAGDAPGEVVRGTATSSAAVVCGVFGLAPLRTPFGKISHGSSLLSGMWLPKSAYWKMNSFSFEPLSIQLWFTLIELNVFSLVLHAEGALRSVAPYGWEFVLRP